MKATPKPGTLLLLIPISILTACVTKSFNIEKTLVSWVIVDSKEADGGSIITLQDGECFDGIILSGEASSWIA